MLTKNIASDSNARQNGIVRFELVGRFTLLLIIAGVLAGGCGEMRIASDDTSPATAAKPTSEVILASEVNWEQLNPARGDKSPKAGTLWGDRKANVATGFLVQFVDGFSSPPHIHNITYRGVVIHGLVHNDDPNAARMWMPTSSFWTQPKGEVHITAAKGKTNVAYIEIEEGPYLVLPPKKAFETAERPINVDASNIVWVNQPGMPASADGPKTAFLWGSPQDGRLCGTLIKLPAGFAGKITPHGSTLRAVVIRGRLTHRLPDESNDKTLEPGSYFSSQGESAHRVSCEAANESILYVRTDGKFDVMPMKR